MQRLPAWYVDPALAVLIRQWKSRHPNATVYTIADNLHGPESDHQPEEDNSVDAADFMPGNGVTMGDIRRLADILSQHRDPRIAYLIVDQRICSSRPIGKYAAWEWRPYGGKRHDHLHVSRNDNDESSIAPWKIDPKGTDMNINQADADLIVDRLMVRIIPGYGSYGGTVATRMARTGNLANVAVPALQDAVAALATALAAVASDVEYIRNALEQASADPAPGEGNGQ